MKRASLFVLLVFLPWVLFPTLSFAHGGGLDTYGCHHDRKHGGYHCHQGPFAGQTFASKTEMLSQLEAITRPPDDLSNRA